MPKKDLHKLFIEELEDIYSAEQQIVHALPKLIKAASLKELKTALSHHLEETKYQVERLEEIFSILGIEETSRECEGMRGLLKEANEMVDRKAQSPTLDAAIISAAQKVEHYEIASYGTLRSFAKHLDLDKQIPKLLQETLNEEAAADKKLTKLADGTFWAGGVNQDAAEMVKTR